MTSADELLISRLLDFDMERLYQVSRAQHRTSGMPIEQCLDGAAKRAGFEKGFSSLYWNYEYALNHALSRMTLLGLYETHPVAAKWLLLELAADLSKQLVAISAEWELYAKVLFDNAVTTDEYLASHSYGFLEQSGWHLWPGIASPGCLSRNAGFSDASVLLAIIGYTFYKAVTADLEQLSPLALARQQFCCEKSVLLLDLEVVESAWKDSEDIEVGLPSLSYYSWAKPTPKHCYAAVEAGIRLMQLRQQVALSEGGRPPDWAFPPRTLNNALHKYRRAYFRKPKAYIDH